ncbi:MAG: tetratricopeptide repeat protein [Deltaproteobacteria bacterium]|nr:tetratricopeptide repeat protein [Deltaproteobacteria bacterium]
MTPPEIDQLIEEGLTLYGQGDLDGALLAWEKALASDPENAQANSYVDYVRINYDLLTGEVPNDESKVPFGLDDEPYQIEIFPGELERVSAPDLKKPDAVDEGWFMDDESAPAATVSFEDQTREYQNANRVGDETVQTFAAPPESARPEFGDVDLTPGLHSPAQGFATQPTGVRDRDTGFVKPTARAHRPSQVPSELKMTLRTPGETEDPYTSMNLASDSDVPPASATISLSYDDPPGAADELISSLPSPTPTPLRGSHPLDPLTGQPRTDTAEFSGSLRRPALDAPTLPSTITRDFESQKTNAAMPKLSATQTVELSPNTMAAFRQELVSAPTRDLGIRPLGGVLAAAREDDTGFRKAIAAASVGDGTRADVILPFDPIDARSAQILDEVDEGAPDREQKEDRTRRRITVLFEKAIAWSQAGELDKAVAAIDLALSEDPNSALGQKLVHRHRDHMLQVFQAFLGNLDRQPILARPLHELANAPISPRAAFLLSRIDGMVTMDELLDVSGMPRLEAYRYLCQLFLRGILR